ncbi:MAG: DUF3108 domain-containing protein [Candidatus Omnitrophica bacterium]|nr:DUF3108 domain-containing protein [Candidatus Omnitrophota bacterium]
MNKIVILIIVLVVLFSAIFWHNNRPEPIVLNIIDQIDKPAFDEAVYRINFFGVLPAGNATFSNSRIEELNNQKVIHLSAKAENLNIFAKFFKVTALLDSYIDPVSLNPQYFKETLSLSGKKESTKEVFYNQKGNIVTIRGVERSMLPNTQDPLSAILNLRRMDFNKLKDFDLSLNTNQKNYAIKGKVSVLEKTINNKKYTFYVLNGNIFRRDKNNPYHRSSITMVLLKEKENLPVLIKVFASGLFINARLTDLK